MFERRLHYHIDWALVAAIFTLCGLGVAFMKPRKLPDTFVTRDQLRRVMQVFVPTFLFVALTQWLGI